MKRIVSFLITLVLTVCSIPFSANAQVVNDFIPNSNIEYTLDTKQGTLEIKGAGEIPDSFNSPFAHIADYVKVVTVCSGITSIGKRLFRNCTAVERISIADTINDIDVSAFDGCTSLKEIYVDVDNEMYSSFDGVLYTKNLSMLVRYPQAKASKSFETLKNTSTICKGSFGGVVYLKSITLSEETVNILEDFDELGLEVNKSDSPQIDVKHKHQPVYRTVNPTCTEFGYVEYTCKTCDIRLINEYICPVGHKLVEKIVGATDNSNGHLITYCAVCGYVQSDELIYSIDRVSLEYTGAVYDGYQFSPNVSVVNTAGNELSLGTDYVYALPLGRKNVGMYTYDVCFIGNYSGMARLFFFIYPQCPVFKKIILRPGEADLIWTTVNAQCDGYEIVYSTSPDFSKNNRYIIVEGRKKSSVTIDNLKSKRRYYFRIRSYKRTNDNNTFYSNWTKVGSAVMI